MTFATALIEEKAQALVLTVEQIETLARQMDAADAVRDGAVLVQLGAAMIAAGVAS